MNYISIKNLLLTYKKNTLIPILNIPSMEIKKGEIVGFFGPNHVGKSTLLKYISQIHNEFYINQNAIFFEEQIYDKKNQNPLIMHIPQDYASSLFPWYSIKENLRIILKALNFSKEKIENKIINFCDDLGFDSEDELLKYYGFMSISNNDLIPKQINQLSGGQQQILVIMRTLLVNSNILTMDEPFSAIDTFSKGEEFRKKITTYLKKHNITTIIVSHELEEIIKFVDTLYIFDYDIDSKGKVLKGKVNCINANKNTEKFIQNLKSSYQLELRQ